MASILEQNTADLQAILDAVNNLPDGDGSSGSGSGSGSGTIKPVSPKAVNFYDYDGTCLYAYTVEEAQALAEMPPLPEREGLICQGWNWSLEDVKACNMAVNVGATYTTDDGTTRIYITLTEGRTSPMLGVCPNGTVTVDWGDGTEPDVLTGTSTTRVQRTPNHEYAKPGDYVIRLTVDGEMGLYGSSGWGGIITLDWSVDRTNLAYLNSVWRIDLGNNVKAINEYALYACYSLKSVVIPNSVTSIASNAFSNCLSLKSVVIPNSITSIASNTFSSCTSLESVAIPNSITDIASRAFYMCNCSSIFIPNGVPNVGMYTFYMCRPLKYVIIPNTVTSIAASSFTDCHCLSYLDFSRNTSIPTLENTNAFTNTPADLEIRVPAALYDEWIAATNWTKYASQIVAV